MNRKAIKKVLKALDEMPRQELIGRINEIMNDHEIKTTTFELPYYYNEDTKTFSKFPWHYLFF